MMVMMPPIRNTGRRPILSDSHAEMGDPMAMNTIAPMRMDRYSILLNKDVLCHGCVVVAYCSENTVVRKNRVKHDMAAREPRMSCL